MPRLEITSHLCGSGNRFRVPEGLIKGTSGYTMPAHDYTKLFRDYTYIAHDCTNIAQTTLKLPMIALKLLMTTLKLPGVLDGYFSSKTSKIIAQPYRLVQENVLILLALKGRTILAPGNARC